MFNREKIFTVYEKPEAADPAERVLLLRDGFSLGALIFALLWLVYKRFWGIALLYLAALSVLLMMADMLRLSEMTTLVLQCWLQVMLAFHAYDLQGWWLRRKGYRFAGVLAAESAMHAERRYYEFAA